MTTACWPPTSALSELLLGCQLMGSGRAGRRGGAGGAAARISAFFFFSSLPDTPPLPQSSSFVKRFPIVKLDRTAYLKTVRGFTFKQGIPNLSSNAYDFR